MDSYLICPPYILPARAAPVCLVHTSHACAHTSNRNNNMEWYSGAPDLLDCRYAQRCRFAVYASCDACDGVVPHEFLPWFFLILSAVINRVDMKKVILAFNGAILTRSGCLVKRFAVDIVNVVDKGRHVRKPVLFSASEKISNSAFNYTPTEHFSVNHHFQADSCCVARQYAVTAINWRWISTRNFSRTFIGKITYG